MEGTIVNYSRAGGGAGNILLIESEMNFSLWIWCYWEIEKSGVMLANANGDTTAVTGEIAVAVRKLEGKRVLKVETDPTWYHLHIIFEDDYELFVYCEQQPDDESQPLNNWEFAVKNLDINYVITCDFSIKQEKYH